MDILFAIGFLIFGWACGEYCIQKPRWLKGAVKYISCVPIAYTVVIRVLT